MNKTWQTPLTMEKWRKLIGRDCPRIIEVGCNDGTDTKRFLDEFPGCRILAFEPERRATERFKRDIDDPRVSLFEVAVGSRDCVVPWNASYGEVPGKCDVAPEAQKNWDLSGSICEPTGHKGRPNWCSWKCESSVVCVSLDRWLSGRLYGEPFDLLWIDAQGAEGAVLEGAQSLLNRTRFVYVEFYDRAFNVQGFDCETLYDGQPGLVQLICLLGKDWTLRGFYNGGNALFENTKWST